MNPEQLAEHAKTVRRFNRFYTRQIGVLHEHLLDSEFSLTEARILYELAHRQDISTADLVRELNLNAGYLSRVVAGFEKHGLVEKTRSPSDARVTCISLTPEGRAAFEPLDAASRREISAMLAQLGAVEQRQLIDAMQQIESLLGGAAPAYLLRDPQPGDMGWIVHRHGALYGQEYGWDMTFEALVADIVAKYVQHADPAAERCWIAELSGKVVGSVFVVRHAKRTAKLRLLYVEPSARGLGIGRRLVEECIRFARQKNYARMVLWTNSVLVEARRIYEKAGFRLIQEAPHHSFGKDLVGETWELRL